MTGHGEPVVGSPAASGGAPATPGARGAPGAGTAEPGGTVRHALFPVRPTIRDYAWGSLTAIAELLGREPDGRPQAELWLGAHPAAPVTVDGVPLGTLLAERPELAGGDLPFLMKVLAAGRPLSLQVHPTRQQASAGYAREDALGIALGDPRRSYADRQHKPEMIVALTPFVALCGFRSPAAAADDLTQLLERSAGATRLLTLLRNEDESPALRTALQLVLSGDPEVRELVAQVVASARDHAGPYAESVRCAGDYGDDPGVLAMVLLNRVELAPGEALYLKPGDIHAYLHGLGIEAMAPSDNVVRGGLTPKHVDVQGLSEIVQFAVASPTRVMVKTSVEQGVQLDSYWPPVEDFAVHRIAAGTGTRELPLPSPAMVIVTKGSLDVAAGGEHLTLRRGDSAFHALGSSLTVTAVRGPAEAYLTTVGRSS